MCNLFILYFFMNAHCLSKKISYFSQAIKTPFLLCINAQHFLCVFDCLRYGSIFSSNHCVFWFRLQRWIANEMFILKEVDLCK